VPPALAKAQAESGHVVLGNWPGPGTVTPVMRVNVAPFNDPQVVKAFKLLTRRDQFVTTVYDGYATLGNDAPFAHIKNWAGDIKPKYDPSRR